MTHYGISCGCGCHVEDVPKEFFDAWNMIGPGYSTVQCGPDHFRKGFETIVPGMCEHMKRYFYKAANRYLGNDRE